MPDRSEYQKKIIKRYYENLDTIAYQRLAELASELYLAEGKKRDQLWKRAGKALAKAGLSEARIAHLLEKKDPRLLAEVVTELGGK